ncbi:MAG: hypothetical protein C0478_13485 [Planctomyces sp.]|nr:hypothetical protein [Planctomyces sp.]
MSAIHHTLYERFRANWPGYWRRWGHWYLVATLAATADWISTWQFMMDGRIEDELHPAVRLVSHWLGPMAGPLVAKLAQLTVLAVVTATFERYARVIFLVVIFTYSYAAWFNTWGHQYYTPVFARYLSW